MAVTRATVSDVAAELGVPYKTVHMWIKRRHNTGFPEPIHVVVHPGGTRHEVYDMKAVKKWKKTYVPRKGGAPKGNLNAVRHGKLIGKKTEAERDPAEVRKRVRQARQHQA